MTTPLRPTVSDPALQATLDECGPNIENYHANLDNISNDIKAVEQYFASSGVRVERGIAFAFGPIIHDDTYSPLSQVIELLRWAPDPKNPDRWRLLWTRVNVRPPDMPDEKELFVSARDATFQGRAEILDDKPLLETPLNVRHAAHAYLSELVRELSGAVAPRPQVEIEIPF